MKPSRGGGGVRKWWRIGLLIASFVAAAAAATAGAAPVDVATGGSSPWGPSVEAHPLWWAAVGTLSVAGSGLVVRWMQRLQDQWLAELVPVSRRPESWVVNRPTEVRRVVKALCRRVRTTEGTTV